MAEPERPGPPATARGGSSPRRAGTWGTPGTGGLSGASSPSQEPGQASGASPAGALGPHQQAAGQPSLPSIALPKGGGAIRGIDEKLSVAQATGAAALTVPVFVSAARQDSAPGLALSYSSGAGNSPFGLGWALPVPSITRKTSKGLPRYDDAVDSDVLILSGAEDLVPLLVDSGGGWAAAESKRTVGATTYVVRGYRPRVESEFARIERWEASPSGEVHWRTISRANVTNLYGRSENSRIADPEDPSRVFSWLLELSYDDRGNAVSYSYKAEDSSGAPSGASEVNRTVSANRYLKSVRYGNEVPFLPVGAEIGALPSEWCFELVLDYGEHDLETPTPAEVSPWPCRLDPFSSYRAGFEVRTYRTCRRLLMFHRFEELGEEPVLVRSTDLSYETGFDPPDPTRPVYSLLASVTQTGWVAKPGPGAGYESEALPALKLGYSPLAMDEQQQQADPLSVQNVTGDLDGAHEQWVDLEGEGLQGILTEDDGGWYYKRNVSAWNPSGGPAEARFEPLTLIREKPALGGRGALTLKDLNGDGNLSAVSFAPQSAGWFEYDADSGWGPFRELQTTASVDWTSPDLRFLDLDGDGLADVLITEDDAFTWFEWTSESGFQAAERVARVMDEERGPAIILGDPTGSIFLADMSGDGLTDLVRIRSGEVCYWPNLGYGRFGAKIAMDDAPAFDFSDRFDPRRIRLADIDGSGTADLLYLGEQATIWFNQSGNSWTDGHTLSQFPGYDDDVQASALDLLGTGTAALVWTSPLPGDTAVPLRYIDLTGGIKPYLLTSASNALGARRTLTYAPSTKFYLQDRAAGTPWLTRLPFPVHVVERLQTEDAVSRTSYACQYSYHHGFYDGVEREFRGFARVDALDTDIVPAQSGIGTFSSTPESVEGEFVLPAVLTRSWFHTGAFFEREDIAARLAQEYYAGDPKAPHLATTMLPTATSAEELREACRALRGRTLREEVYAHDGTPAAVNPYLTSEYRYEVDPLQPASASSYGSFYAWQRESVACHYERDPSDPRIAHELSLAIDGYGNVTREASVGYPRRAPEYPAQAATWVRYREHEFTNVASEADWYRLGLAVETRDYQLTGVPPEASGLYDPVTLATHAAAATPIPYEQAPTEGSAQRRLLGRTRRIYRRDDLSAPLPLGQVQRLALLDASYALRYTPGLLEGVFAGKLSAAETDTLLSGPGAFLDLDGDGNRWAPSAKLFYSPEAAHPEAAYAQEHFYLPQGSVDPWQNVSTLAYDAHNLLPASSTDALLNTTQARSNYRVLSPWLITDPNLNLGGVRYDALGMVVATAAMGKEIREGEYEGDYLDTSTPEASAHDDPTTRLEYDLGAFAAWEAEPAHDVDHPRPVWVKTEARERHKDPATPWLSSYAYSDGLGRVALTKAQAEPGEAPVRDEKGELLRDGEGRLVFAPSETRWVGSGRIVYDNKGNPVKAYEPFFDSSPVYDDESDLVEWGVTAITRYDPLSRPVRVDNPNGTLRTVEPDPWHVVTSDENDTVLESAWYGARSGGARGQLEGEAATKAAAHAHTPASADLDSLGRTFRSVADNGAEGQYATLLELDIDGHTLSTTDALGRVVLTRAYDLAGAVLHSASVDAGERWVLADAGGQPLEAWDSRATVVRSEYDALRRPTNVRVRSGEASELLAEQTTYGESLANAQELNLRGAPYQHRDGAGIAGTAERDFNGNVVRVTRQLLREYDGTVDWASAPALEAETFATSTTFDALNRPVTMTTPDGSVSQATYNQRSLLAAMSVKSGSGGEATDYVSAITYDAKAQRLQLSYGNGARTDYSYDPLTFRLTELQSARPSGSLQELGYTYDPVGNVTHVHDGAQQTIFFNNTVVTPDADYTYDAIYRLLKAEGREHIGQTESEPVGYSDRARAEIPLPGDWEKMRKYTQKYAYDAVGNIEELAHTATGGGYTRTYAYDEPALPPANNRLTSTSIGATREQYAYDANGNMESMPQLSLMRSDWNNRLEATASQIVVEGAPQTTYYRYDAHGARVRKVTDNQNGGARASERIYVGPYEIYRGYGAGGTVTLERQTLHITDSGGRICLLETTTIDASEPKAAATTPTTLARYQLGNLLGSAVLELDESAAIISYEEYYPYGSTSFQSGRSAAEVSLKRYRYTGKERDEESGLYYHGQRYYAPWLGRWTACDPAGFVDGVNSYAYVRNNPIALSDPTGRQAQPEQAPPPADPLAPVTPTGPVAQPTPPPQSDVGPFRLYNPPKLSLTPGEHEVQELGLSLPPLHISGGTGTLWADMGREGDQGSSSLRLTGRAKFETGPLTFKLNLDARGRTDLPFSVDTLGAFRGEATVTGDVRALGVGLGHFELHADAEEGHGTLSLRGFAGPGPLHIATFTGSGTFEAGGYSLRGSAQVILPPAAYAHANWSLSSGEGFRASGHYVGIQFGPFGLVPSLDPFASLRPGNMTLSPTDTPSALQLNAPTSPPTGPMVSSQTFSSGPSVGYSYFQVHGLDYRGFSVGFAPLPSLATSSPAYAPLPFPLSVVPSSDTLLYGQSLSTPTGKYGVYTGLSFWGSF